MATTKVTISFWYETRYKDKFMEMLTQDPILIAEVVNKGDLYDGEESTISFTDCEITINIHQLTILLHTIKMFGRYAQREDTKRYQL
jgi:hypothetical protein